VKEKVAEKTARTVRLAKALQAFEGMNLDPAIIRTASQLHGDGYCANAVGLRSFRCQLAAQPLYILANALLECEARAEAEITLRGGNIKPRLHAIFRIWPRS
jgi:hypothetical protein